MNKITIVRMTTFSLIGTLYLVIPNARPDFTRFNCHDSESYVALAYNLTHGRGYTRALPPAPYLPHTTWPPGMPALLVPAVALSGGTVNWLLVKCTMSLLGSLGVVFTWFYLRRVSESGTVADLGALAVAANPYYWDFSHQAMAEVPLTVWLIGGLLLVDRVWARRSVLVWEAAVAGLICGVGMLFKGHAGALMLAPLAYVAGYRRCALSAPFKLSRWLVYASGFMVPQLLWKIRSSWVTASGFEGINHFRSMWAVDPNDPSSRLMSWSEVGTTAVQNVRHYVDYWLPSQVIPGFWPDSLWDWKGSGFLAMALSLVVLVLAVPRRSGAWPACLVAFPMASLNVVYALGGNARFWMPVTTMLTIAIVANYAPRLVGLQPRIRRIGLATIAILVVTNLIAYMLNHEKHPYAESKPWRQLAQLFEGIARRDDLQPMCVLTQTGNNLAFQLMTGYTAPLPQANWQYSHIITTAPEDTPPGSQAIYTVEPWHLVVLAEPMTWEEIDDHIPIANGQYIRHQKQ
jgi:Dolichyl-phosphate-mannose-protein mannosyltransferase